MLGVGGASACVCTFSEYVLVFHILYIGCFSLHKQTNYLWSPIVTDIATGDSNGTCRFSHIYPLAPLMCTYQPCVASQAYCPLFQVPPCRRIWLAAEEVLPI